MWGRFHGSSTRPCDDGHTAVRLPARTVPQYECPVRVRAFGSSLQTEAPGQLLRVWLESASPLGYEPPECGVDLFSGVRDRVDVEPPCEQTHAGSGDELHGCLELHRVALSLRELGMEVRSNKVLDVLLED